MLHGGVGQFERVTLDQVFYTHALSGVTAVTAGADTTRWIRDPGGNLVSQRDHTGQRAYYLTDGLGSTIALIDETGQVRTRYTYSPYGETDVSCHGGGCIENPWRYTGEYQDATGLYKIGERYLSPELGRWTQADPAAHRINPGSPGEPNSYAYAACNPINNTDPTGLAVEDYALSCVLGAMFRLISAKISGGISLAVAVKNCGVSMSTIFVMNAIGINPKAQLLVDLNVGFAMVLFAALS